MDPEKVQEKDGKARRTNIVAIEEFQFLDIAYRLICWPEHFIGDTGLLSIFELIPRSPGQPRFIGRWDEKAGVLDVDIREVGKSEEAKFKKGVNGYHGHHPVVVDELNHIFEVEIRYRASLIFKGVISFGLHRELGLFDGLSIADDIILT